MSGKYNKVIEGLIKDADIDKTGQKIETLYEECQKCDTDCYHFLANNKEFIKTALHIARQEGGVENETAKEIIDALDDIVQARVMTHDQILEILSHKK